MKCVMGDLNERMVRSIMNDRGMRQLDLAMSAQMTSQQVSRMFAGGTISLCTLRRVAAALDVGPGELIQKEAMR